MAVVSQNEAGLDFWMLSKGDVPERGLNYSNGNDTLILKPVHFVVPLSPHTPYLVWYSQHGQLEMAKSFPPSK